MYLHDDDVQPIPSLLWQMPSVTKVYGPYYYLGGETLLNDIEWEVNDLCD